MGTLGKARETEQFIRSACLDPAGDNIFNNRCIIVRECEVLLSQLIPCSLDIRNYIICDSLSTMNNELSGTSKLTFEYRLRLELVRCGVTLGPSFEVFEAFGIAVR